MKGIGSGALVLWWCRKMVRQFEWQCIEKLDKGGSAIRSRVVCSQWKR